MLQLIKDANYTCYGIWVGGAVYIFGGIQAAAEVNVAVIHGGAVHAGFPADICT